MSKSSKNTNNYPCLDHLDPCKAFGCALQQCYIDMQKQLTRSSAAINDKSWCGTEREKLEQCRTEHNLPGCRPKVEQPKAETPPTPPDSEP